MSQHERGRFHSRSAVATMGALCLSILAASGCARSLPTSVASGSRGEPWCGLYVGGMTKRGGERRRLRGMTETVDAVVIGSPVELTFETTSATGQKVPEWRSATRTQ